MMGLLILGILLVSLLAGAAVMLLASLANSGGSNTSSVMKLLISIFGG